MTISTTAKNKISALILVFSFGGHFASADSPSREKVRLSDLSTRSAQSRPACEAFSKATAGLLGNEDISQSVTKPDQARKLIETLAQYPGAPDVTVEMNDAVIQTCSRPESLSSEAMGAIEHFYPCSPMDRFRLATKSVASASQLNPAEKKRLRSMLLEQLRHDADRPSSLVSALIMVDLLEKMSKADLLPHSEQLIPKLEALAQKGESARKQVAAVYKRPAWKDVKPGQMSLNSEQKKIYCEALLQEIKSARNLFAQLKEMLVTIDQNSAAH